MIAATVHPTPPRLYAATCPNCGEQFRFPTEVVMFGGEVVCPYCQQTSKVGSDAADKLVSGLDDFRRKLR